MVDVTGLELYRAFGDVKHARGDAVRTEPIDNPAIADFPQEAPDTLSRPHEEEIVQLVEVPFVVEEGVDHPAAGRHLRRQLRMQDVIVIGDRETNDGGNEGGEP